MKDKSTEAPPTQVDMDRRLNAALFEFSEDYENGVREATYPANFPASGIEPLFEGNTVSEPLAIAKAGTYIKLQRSHDGKIVAQKIEITANDLESMTNNSTRDVPLNQEHYMDGPNYSGWVRSKTLSMHVADDEYGRATLFAHLEATPETLELIRKGRFRDFSPELDLMQKRLRGLALTNYPVMQEIHQFSEGVESPAGVDFKETPMTEEAKKELLAEFQAGVDTQLSELRAELEQERAARTAAEKAAAEQRLAVEFSQRVQNLVKDADGNARILPSGADAALQLYLFAATNSEHQFNFGEGDEVKTVNAVGLLDELFSHLPTVGLYKQVADDTASSAPANFSEENNGLDIAAMTAAARNYMGAF